MKEAPEQKKSHIGLILFTAFSIWWCLFGVGFVALHTVNRRKACLALGASPGEKKQIQIALNLAQISVALFIMDWSALILLLVFRVNLY